MPATTAKLLPEFVQDMLSQYSGKDRGIHKLDSALKDAVQMVRVSDERISYLRKMHAQLLLKRQESQLKSQSLRFFWPDYRSVV